MTLYMKTTTDKYELPIAVADSTRELAAMLGIPKGSVATMVCKQICGYHKIEIGETTMTENEIVRNYRASKNKHQQIEILADLNETTAEEIKKILKAHGVDLRGGNFRAKKAAVINQDFEDAVNEMIEQDKEQPVIEAADPVPGEIGYQAPEEKEPPFEIPPRHIAEMMFNEARIKDIIRAMFSYYVTNTAIPEE